MKQPEDNKTAELPGLKRRPGRPPLGHEAMSAAERQRAYRQRRKDARWVPGSALDELSRVELLDRLSSALATAGDGEAEDQDMREGAAAVAESVIAEIVTRYELRLTAIKRKAASSRVTK